MFVSFLHHTAKPRGQLAGQQQPRGGLAARQVLDAPIRKIELRRGHHNAGVVQQPLRHLGQDVIVNDHIRVQDKVYIAGQAVHNAVVALAEAEVLGQADHLHASIAKICLRQAGAAAIRAGVIHHIQGKVIAGVLASALRTAAHTSS